MVHLNKQFINLLFLPYIRLYLTIRVPRVLSEELNIEPRGRTPIEPENRNSNNEIIHQNLYLSNSS